MKNELNKKRIKNICVLLVGIIISFWRINWVYADDITVHSNKYYSEYFMVANFENKLYFNHFRIYSFNDRPAYAIDVDNNVVVWGYYYTDDYLSHGLTLEQVDYIQLISYYGYEYPSHRNDYRYFMVTQELILEYLLGIDFYWTEKMEINAEAVDLSGYKNKVLELVSKHSILPSFNLSTNNYLLGEEIELVDVNSVLSNYEIINNDGLVAEINGNSLVIQSEWANAGEYTLRLKKKNYIDDLPYIYYADNSQTLFTPGKIEELECEVKVKISGAVLEIQKYDSNNSDVFVSDSEYGLYDVNNNLVTTFILDECGKTVLTDLDFGIYKLKELRASYGYMLDENVYTIDINQKNNEFIVYGQSIVKKLQILKTYDNENLFDNGCFFDILNEDGELYKSIVTDENGYGSVMLPYGKYIIRQRNIVHGYKKIDDFEVNINEYSDNVISYKLHSDAVYENNNIVLENPKTDDDIENNIFSVVVIIFSLMIIWIYIIKKNML